MDVREGHTLIYIGNDTRNEASYVRVAMTSSNREPASRPTARARAGAAVRAGGAAQRAAGSGRGGLAKRVVKGERAGGSGGGEGAVARGGEGGVCETSPP